MKKANMKRRWSVVAIGSLVALQVGAVGVAVASPPIAAAGVLTQTSITGGGARLAGPNVILESGTIHGSVTGTLSGTTEDRLTVVIHPDGRFSAHGTSVCQCTVQGKVGQLELRATTNGQIVGPETGLFAGRWVITKATGELAGLSGNLATQGTVNIVTGLSTIDYSGQIHPGD